MAATTPSPTDGLRRGQVLDDFNTKRQSLRRAYPVPGLTSPVNSAPPPVLGAMTPKVS
jgi:hypothetical protein